MVYYYTSGNVKMLRNILADYNAVSDLSPYEYMQSYIEKCPESTEDSKLEWIAETFLSFYKHEELIRSIVSHLHEELSEEEQAYFMIIFHAVIFQLEAKDMQHVYKCLFNLSKSLLNTFAKFLSNNEILTFISHVAQSYYDSNYITEKIIGPLFEWQPYISEMEHSYAAYVTKMEKRKTRLPTVPVQPNVMNRKAKETTQNLQPVSLPTLTTTVSQTHKKKKRMLTKSTIDQRLQQCHDKNKQRAEHLLNDVRNKDFHYAQSTKSEKYFTKLSYFKDDVDSEWIKPFKPRPSLTNKNKPEVKETATTVKRLNKRIQMEEQEEIKWLQNVICFRNTTKIEEIAENDRQERERERLLDIEKKHLLGLITYEEAVLSKKKLVDENRKKYEEFLKEKQKWIEEIEKWQRCEMEKNRKNIEKQAIVELNILHARNEICAKKKEAADTVKKETESLLSSAMQIKMEELQQKIAMIKEIKILELISKKSRIGKVVDLTETPNLGLLCEMSVAELQERLGAMKIQLKDELDRKRKSINEEKQVAKQELEETKNTIKTYMEERAQIRKHNKKINKPLSVTCTATKELRELKKVLEQKRDQRIKIQNPLPLC